VSSALPLINIYVCTKFNFNPFCTFQDMRLFHQTLSLSLIHQVWWWSIEQNSSYRADKVNFGNFG